MDETEAYSCAVSVFNRLIARVVRKQQSKAGLWMQQFTDDLKVRATYGDDEMPGVWERGFK